MIELYTTKKALKSNIDNIYSVDMEFDKQIYDIKVTNKDKEHIKIIDDAIYEGNGYVVTPFGRTEIQNLSTGCKALILINHSKELGDPVINISECGSNVLDIIFSMDNIKIMMEFCNIPYKYNPDKKITVIKARSKKVMTLREVFEKAWL